MKGWREVELKEITEPVKKTYKPTGSDNIIYIGLEHIEQNSLRLNSCGHSTDISSNKYIFEKGDILFGKLRPYFRKIVKPKFSGICSTDIWVFKNKEGFIQDYIFYFLANSEFIDLTNIGEGGTRMPRADWKFLSQTKWLVPPKDEQKAIANVLSSLDDKIDLLHRQNETLEKMAETLVQQNLSSDLETKIINLGKIINIFDSKRIPLSSTIRQSMKNGLLYPYYGAASVMDFINDYIFDGEYLLFGEDGTVQTAEGNPILQLTTGKFWANNHTHVLSVNKPYSNFILYIILKKTNISHLITGAVQPKINQENLKSLIVSVPNFIQIQKIEKITSVFWNKIKNNKISIKTLQDLRDTFLPKLMSGEISIL